MELSLPVIGHVVSVENDLSHEHFWVENACVLWNRASSSRKDSTKDTKIEQYCTMWGDLEMYEDVRIKDSSKKKNGYE